MQRVYLDWNATSPIRPEAAARMVETLSTVGNPSSVHAEGRAARDVVETARRWVARLVGAQEAAVTFTASGTEAAATALTQDWLVAGIPTRLDQLLVGATEHACVLSGGRFPSDACVKLPVNEAGRLDLSALAATLAGRRRRSAVAVQAANNETGVVQPVAEIAGIVHAYGGILICDAVQAVGRLEMDITALGADALIVSAHKIGGPQGVGALVLADDATAPSALIRGGGQEFGRRAGTEAVPAIAGFGVAASLAGLEMKETSARLLALRDMLEREARIRVPGAVVFGDAASRLPNTSLLGIEGVSAATLVMALDLSGFAVSSGAACSSGKVKRSHVLDAMGVPKHLAESAVRVSLGRGTTEVDIARFLEAFETATKRLYRRSEADAA